jgi:hypothetical protein
MDGSSRQAGDDTTNSAPWSKAGLAAVAASGARITCALQGKARKEVSRAMTAAVR